MSTTGVNTTYSNSAEWKDGFYSSSDGSRCYAIKYAEVSANDPITQSDNLSLSFTKDQHRVDITFNNISLEGVAGNTRKVPMSLIPGQTAIYGGWSTYTDAACTTRSDSTGLSARNGERMFVEMNIKLYREGSSSVFTADDLYLVLPILMPPSLLKF